MPIGVCLAFTSPSTQQFFVNSPIIALCLIDVYTWFYQMQNIKLQRKSIGIINVHNGAA